MAGMPAGALIEVAVEPKRQEDRPKFAVALETIARRDPNFRFSIDDSMEQTVLGGISETQLDTIVHELQTEFGVALNIGNPQVAYRETISRPVDVDYSHKVQRGGSGQFARVHLAFQPGAPGSGFVFENAAGDAVPDTFVSGVARGLESARQAGVLAGFPLIDFRATLVGGAYHELDSSEATFEIATRSAVRMLKEKRAIVLLEPVMHVEVVTSDEFATRVEDSLKKRRGAIAERVRRADGMLIMAALVPLTSLWGYQNDLLTITEGGGQLTQQFDHYRPVGTDDDPDTFPPAAAMRA